MAGPTTMFARSPGDRDDADFAFGGAGASGDDADVTPPRAGRPGRTDLTAGRERTIHFQPEDRYWTDYLRIALPVIGLVLMLGLFWYWATAIISDNDGNEPITTPPGQALLNNAPTASPTAAPDQNAPAGQGDASTELAPADQTATAGAQGSGDQAAADQTPADTSGGDNQAADQEAADGEAGEIAVDMEVVVTESVRLRPDASTEQEEIRLLEEGEVLTVVDGPVEGEAYDWWGVVTEEGESGWVAADFIAPAE